MLILKEDVNAFALKNVYIPENCTLMYAERIYTRARVWRTYNNIRKTKSFIR